mmetsp:Transcript_57613/g.136980  ORF Transcript_57613/g.136980 Transcript_57613/m.136980 type:complete len:388 (+) Transcript_57613:73-1236(+)
MQRAVASRCCGCKGTGALEEDEGAPLELDLLEAKEQSVQLAIRAPKPPSRSGIGFITPARNVRPGPTLEFVVSVMGGPYSDINGPVEERIGNASYGSRITHEVKNLHPETEYTITVTMLSMTQNDSAPLLSSSAAAAANSSGSGVKIAQMEVRTASASTALFAGEDWRGPQPAEPTKGSYSKSPYSADPKAATGKGKAAGASSSSGAASSSSGQAAAAARQQDETSTIAPSEGGEVDPHRLESMSDSDDEREQTGHSQQADAGSAAAAAASSGGGLDMTLDPDGPTGLEVVEVADVREVGGLGGRTTACNLCSMMDCMKQRQPHGEEGEVIIERAVAKKVVAPAAPKKKQWRPYRIPFPGTPVDPASVGLTIPPQAQAGFPQHRPNA